MWLPGRSAERGGDGLWRKGVGLAVAVRAARSVQTSKDARDTVTVHLCRRLN